MMISTNERTNGPGRDGGGGGGDGGDGELLLLPLLRLLNVHRKSLLNLLQVSCCYCW